MKSRGQRLAVMTFAALLCLADVRAAPLDTTADAVLGQVGFNTNLPNQGGTASAATLYGDRGLFVDATGRLWVADTSNNRVLCWTSATSFTNGQAAELVFGQANFSDTQENRGGFGPNANTHAGPKSVCVDSAGRCYVADSGNKRILRYDPPFTNGMNAVQVFGQAGDFTTANQAATNAATADNLGNPDGIAIDKQDNLWCADRFLSRVVRYNTPAAGGSDTTADLVIGQPNFTSADANQNGNPAANTLYLASGCGLDTRGNLYVADEFNNRILLYLAPLVTNMAASRVFGQPDFTSNAPNNGGRSASSMNNPIGTTIDPITGRLFVADALNMRILEFRHPLTDDTVADRVFGQLGDFATGIANNGGLSADSLDFPAGVAVDASGQLFAGDRFNNRVLRFSSLCGTSTSDPAVLTYGPEAIGLPSHYLMTPLCPATTITFPFLIAFANDGASDNMCAGQRVWRLFAGRKDIASGKIWRIRQNCTAQQFGPFLCSPESVMVDVNGRWQGSCSVANLLIIGACNTIYFVSPSNGAICEQYPDPTFAHIGQIAINSSGRLFVGSVDGNSLNVLDKGVVEPFYTAPGLTPRAVTVDTQDNVYLTCATDGILRKIAPDGTVINSNLASGLTGAISQAIAPPGVFHGSIFVACGDRVMEVDPLSGVTSTFLPCQDAAGIAFDPDGFLYISGPNQDQILRIGPNLPGDMNGDGVVAFADLPGFTAALLQLPDSPLPMVVADMNWDGCADGLDIQAFVNLLTLP